MMKTLRAALLRQTVPSCCRLALLRPRLIPPLLQMASDTHRLHQKALEGQVRAQIVVNDTLVEQTPWNRDKLASLKAQSACPPRALGLVADTIVQSDADLFRISAMNHGLKLGSCQIMSRRALPIRSQWRRRQRR